MSHPSLESRKARIVAAWEALEAAYIIRACKGFCSRVEAVIAAECGYIEGAVGEGMWFVIPCRCFKLLLNICEPVAFVCEKVRRRQDFPRTLYLRPKLICYLLHLLGSLLTKFWLAAV